MYKNLRLVVFIIAVLLLSACGGNGDNGNNGDSGGNAGKSENLRAASSYPTSDRSIGAFGQPLLENIMEQTDEINVEMFTGGELVEVENDIESLNSGAIDIAMALSPTLDPKRFPYSGVFALPLLESNAHIAAEAVKNLVESDVELSDGKTFYELEIEDKGLFAFPVHPTEAYLISTANEKLETVDDFNESVRIRISSNVHEILLGELGLTPQSLPANDIYDAMSRGALEGALFSVPDWPAFGVGEVSNYAITGVSLGHFPMYFAMTQETWDSFSDDVQSLFEDEAAERIQSAPDLYEGDVEEILAEFEDRGGELLDFNEMDADVQDKISEAIYNTWNLWIEDLEERGHAGKEVAILWRDYIVDAGGVVPEEIMNLE